MTGFCGGLPVTSKCFVKHTDMFLNFSVASSFQHTTHAKIENTAKTGLTFFQFP